ncbi:MAG: hypothetical protein RLZZ387_4175 [Chloroflexota bacterium]|jgi:multiple sugar transport system substrate-binding protein
MPRHAPVALLIALMLIAACGAPAAQQPTPPPEQATPTTNPAEPVTIGFAAQESEREVFEPLIAQFEAENPGIRIQFVAVDELLREANSSDIDQINRRIVSAADTAAPFFIRAEDVQAGIFADLQPLADADATFDQADFQPGALESFRRDGGLFALPRTLQVSLLSYNRDLLTARGLAEPTPDITWGELLALAEQLAERRGGEVETYGYVDWSGGMLPLMGLLDEADINLFATPTEQVRLDDPAIEEVLARVAAHVESGAISGPPGIGGAPGDVQPLIREGRAGMWPADMLFIGQGEPALGFELGVVPLPQIAMPLFGAAQTYVMSAGTQHPQEAWRWLSFISAQNATPSFGGGPGQVPARRSVADQAGYWTSLDEPTAAAVRAALERQMMLPSIGNFDGRAFEALNTAISSVAGGATPAVALRDAQAELDELVAATSATPSPAPDTGPVVVTLPELEVAAEGATRITFAVYGADPSAVRAVAREFNRDNPELFVDVQAQTFSDEPMTLATAAAAADCLSWFGAPGTEELTATLDLRPLVEADAGPSLIEDYPPALLARFEIDGRLHGLPATISFRTLNYNRDLFEAAGIDPPTGDWALADLVQAAEQLTSGASAAKQFGYGTFGAHTDDLVFFVEHSGGMLTAGSGDAIRPTYTTPEVFQGVSLYLDLLRRTSPHTRIQGYTNDGGWGGDIYQLIQQNRLAMWLDRGSFLVFGPDNPQAPDIGVAPPPELDTLRPGDLETSGALMISAATEHPELCWRWLKHLSADASYQPWGFPARISVAESEAYTARAPAGHAEVYRAYREALERTPPDQLRPQEVGGMGVDHYWFFRAADRALQGADLERELAEAQRFAEENLACLRAGGSPPDCAIQTDPEYNGFMKASEAQPAP